MVVTLLLKEGYCCSFFIFYFFLIYCRTTATCNKGEELIRKFNKDQFILAILVDIASQTMVCIIDYLLKNNQVLNLLEEVQSSKVRLSGTVRPLDRANFIPTQNE